MAEPKVMSYFSVWNVLTVVYLINPCQIFFIINLIEVLIWVQAQPDHRAMVSEKLVDCENSGFKDRVFSLTILMIAR